MKTVFLTSLLPEPLFETIRRDSIGAISNANNLFQKNLAIGFGAHSSSLDIVNLPNVGAYPNRYRKLLVAPAAFDFGECIRAESLGFFNLIGVKHLSRYFVLKRFLVEKYKKNNTIDLLFIYDLHVPFLKAAFEYKARFPNVKICLIVPDLHGFTGSKATLFYKIFARLENYLLGKYLGSIDAFVVLSENMLEKLDVNGRPWVVVEGIYCDEGSEDNVGTSRVVDEKVIFYSGSLDRRNGISHLVDAFMKIPSGNYRLVLCGDGDFRSSLETLAALDNRIQFLGQVRHDKVLALQRSSTLLVNPRLPGEDFTRYSFPSKTMEYFASGTPVLMYKLAGVPPSYYEHCYSLNNLDSASLSHEMVSICEKGHDERKAVGDRARSFIFSKCPALQCATIISMMNEILRCHEYSD